MTIPALDPAAPRQVTYSFREWEACPMCGAGRARFRVLGRRLSGPQGRYPRSRSGIATTVVRCKACGLIFSNPQPTPARIEDHYDTPPESYWSEAYFIDAPGYFQAGIATLLSLLEGRRGGKFQALDIGAGIGKGMRALAAAGIEAWGIEPSPSFRKAAVERMGIDPDRLVGTPMEQAEFRAESFDFVTLGAVLEHLHEPAAALTRALGWLRSGGVLHAEVPSADWLMARFANAYFRLLGTEFVTHLSPMHPPYHLFEFTPESFRLNGRMLGYRVERVDHFVCASLAPALLDPVLRRIMRVTRTGMQLAIWIRKESA